MTGRKILGGVLALALAAGVATAVAGSRGAGATGVAEVPTYKVAFMICNSVEETMARFGPLTQYLSDATGVKLEPVAIDTVDFEDAVAQGDIAFTHTNSLLYVILAERLGVKVLTGELRGRHGNESTGVFIVRRDSPIQTLEDLRGKRVGFGPNLAPFGFLAQYDLLQRSGIDPEDDLAFYGIPWGSFKHDKVAYGVYFGEYDAGALPELDLERWDESGLWPEGTFRVIGRSALAPYCTFAATPQAPPELTARFREALLAAGPETTAEWRGERLKVLERSWIDGFVPVDDAAYDVLRGMARRTNMPPYQVFG